MSTIVREEAPTTPAATPSKEAPRYFRVMVDAIDHKDGRPVHINVRVPIMLLRLGVRLASFITPQAQQQVNEALRKEGMNFDVRQIKPEDVNELVDQLRDVSVDIDHEQENVKVRIYAE